MSLAFDGFAAAVPFLPGGAGAARAAAKGASAEVRVGKEIVGQAGHIGPRPTQLEVDPRIVDKYAEILRSGGKVDPIDVVEFRDGRQFITEGHHRYVASQRTGISVDTRVMKGEGPVGFDWSRVVFELFE